MDEKVELNLKTILKNPNTDVVDGLVNIVGTVANEAELKDCINKIAGHPKVKDPLKIWISKVKTKPVKDADPADLAGGPAGVADLGKPAGVGAAGVADPVAAEAEARARADRKATLLALLPEGMTPEQMKAALDATTPDNRAEMKTAALEALKDAEKKENNSKEAWSVASSALNMPPNKKQAVADSLQAASGEKKAATARFNAAVAAAAAAAAGGRNRRTKKTNYYRKRRGTRRRRRRSSRRRRSRRN